MTGRMPGPTSHTFFSQRLRLHYVDWGNPTKPPIVMLHGGRDHCRNWDWAAEALREDWHILAPVTIIAHSLGGQIALRYAGLYPDTVARLAAIEGLGPSPAQLAKYKT